MVSPLTITTILFAHPIPVAHLCLKEGDGYKSAVIGAVQIVPSKQIRMVRIIAGEGSIKPG